MTPQNDPKLVLASGSPRRKQLLENMQVNFTVLIPDIDESRLATEPPDQYVARLARQKALAVQSLEQSKNQVILAADTIVCQGSQVFGKPLDKDDAVRIWSNLSNSSHHVITAVCLLKDDEIFATLCRTEVKFGVIKPAQMDRYWQTGEPQDKAGAYAIQGFASAWVKQINGSYSNVVGLPLCEVNELLTNVDLNWL